MIRMTEKAREGARSLAVAYNAYQEARREFETIENRSTARAVMVWGRMLLDAQERTGVVLSSHIEGIIAHAKDVHEETF